MSKKSDQMRVVKYGLIVIVVVAIVIVLFRSGSFGSSKVSTLGEDNWIKDERGVWVKHGVPSTVPANVKAQQEAIVCALRLWKVQKPAGSTYTYNSECLGLCGKYAVDIVHVPRTKADDLAQNQCTAFKSGQVSKVIEVDKVGNVVRVLD